MSWPALRSATARCLEALDSPNSAQWPKALRELGEQIELVMRTKLGDRDLGASVDGFAVRQIDAEDAQTLHVVGASWTVMPSPEGRVGDQHLPVEAWLSIATGTRSTIRVAGRDLLFASSLSERRFQKLLAAEWPHRIELELD